jgi:hypothetical protein
LCTDELQELILLKYPYDRKKHMDLIFNNIPMTILIEIEKKILRYARHHRRP